MDASFIKAWSTRHPLDNKKGLSDEEARVGRADRTFGLGYKLHLAIDSKSMLPLTCVFASANQNEKKHSLNMLEKTKQILKRGAARLRSVIADSQYSPSKLRNAVCEEVIPYPANQKRDVKGLLRVDKKFKTYGPEDMKKEYHKRPHIEAVYSFLKTQYSLAMNKVRGLRNVTSYPLYSILCLVLNREAAENINRPDKAARALYAAGFSYFMVARSLEQFIAGAVVLTLGEIIFVPASSGFVANIAPADKRGRYMAMFGLFFGIGGSAGAQLAFSIFGALANKELTWGIFGLLGFTTLIGYALLFKMAKNVKKERFTGNQ